MNNRVKWIDHNNKKILYLDFSNTSAGESAKIWLDSDQYIADYNDSGPLLMLTNVANMQYDEKDKEAFRQVRNKYKTLNQKRAVVGATGGIKIMIKLISIFNKNTYFSETDDEAKNWLIMQT